MAFAPKSGREHGRLNIASLGNTKPRAGIWNIEYFAKLFQWASDSSNRVNLNVSPVSGLFRPWNPFHISRLIILIVVYSLYRVTLWSRAHVFGERIKIISPRIADGDSASPIVLIGRIFRVVTSPSHIQPAMVYAIALTLLWFGFAMSCVGNNPETPARFSSTTFNVGFSGDEQNAAKTTVFTTDTVNVPNKRRRCDCASVVFGRHDNFLIQWDAVSAEWTFCYAPCVHALFTGQEQVPADFALQRVNMALLVGDSVEPTWTVRAALDCFCLSAPPIPTMFSFRHKTGSFSCYVSGESRLLPSLVAPSLSTFSVSLTSENSLFRSIPSVVSINYA